LISQLFKSKKKTKATERTRRLRPKRFFFFIFLLLDRGRADHFLPQSFRFGVFFSFLKKGKKLNFFIFFILLIVVSHSGPSLLGGMVG
jgi:hypothetical protein